MCLHDDASSRGGVLESHDTGTHSLLHLLLHTALGSGCNDCVAMTLTCSMGNVVIACLVKLTQTSFDYSIVLQLLQS